MAQEAEQRADSEAVIVHEDMPDAEYHADPCPEPSLSSSMARVLLRHPPAVARHLHPKLGDGAVVKNWDDQTKAKRRGTIMHAMLLCSGPTFAAVKDEEGEYALDWRKKVVKANRDEYLANGIFPILQREYDGADEWRRELTPQLEDRGVYFREGQTEVTILHTYETDLGPIWIRTRLDHVHEYDGVLYINELKTTDDASADALARTITGLGYHVQRAAYVMAACRAWPDWDGRIRYRLVFVQLEPVRLVHVTELDCRFVQIGEQLWRQAIGKWAECVHSNEWPGYGHETTTIEAPDYYAARHLL